MRKTIGDKFEETSRLYHFTSAKAAFSIIESGKLRFGKSYRLNDLIESNRVHLWFRFWTCTMDKSKFSLWC